MRDYYIYRGVFVPLKKKTVTCSMKSRGLIWLNHKLERDVFAIGFLETDDVDLMGRRIALQRELYDVGSFFAVVFIRLGCG